MFRLLVVEDQVDFYQDYLIRIFTQMLPMDKIVLTHAPDLQTALAALAEESWDLVLMDYALGPKFNFHGVPIRDGTDLVAFRRCLEGPPDSKDRKPRIRVWGIAAHTASNRLLIEAGADNAWTKNEVPALAVALRTLLRGHGKKE